jgi:hypothetical protein
MQEIEVDLTLSSFGGSGSIKGHFRGFSSISGLRGGVDNIALFRRTRGLTIAML